MKSNLLHGAEQFYQSWRRKQLWHRIVSGLACVVVFCTVYALILPAITLENEPVCGLEEHTHTDECYTVELQYPQSAMDCVLESGAPVIHTHDEFCYSEDGTLICRLPELEAHSHTSRCYREERTLICTEDEDLGHVHSAACYARHRGELICAEEEDKGHTHGKSCYETDRELTCADESEDHVHDDGCYTETERLVCTEEERPGHTHSDSCYAWTEELTCTEEERPAGHIHTDACYEVTTRLACGKEEVIPHTHGEDCYDDSGALVCDMEEVLEHQHTEACIVPPEGEPWEVRVLTCGLEEHTHSDKCYPAEAAAETPPAGEAPAAEPEEQYLCGLEEHTHTEDCYGPEGNLTCTLAEHIHDAGCLAEEEDSNTFPAALPEGYAEYTFDSQDGLSVVAYAPENAFGGQPVTLKAERLAEDSDGYAEAQANLDAAGDVEYDGFVALDIRFEDADGAEVEPDHAEGRVYVKLDAMALVPDDADQNSVAVQHHSMEMADPVVAVSAEPKVLVQTVADGSEDTGLVEVSPAARTMSLEEDELPEESEALDVTAEFSVESFSVFTVTWTKNGITATLRIHYVDELGVEIAGEYVDTSTFSGDPARTEGDRVHSSHYALDLSGEGYYYQGAYTHPTEGRSVDYVTYVYSGRSSDEGFRCSASGEERWDFLGINGEPGQRWAKEADLYLRYRYIAAQDDTPRTVDTTFEGYGLEGGQVVQSGGSSTSKESDQVSVSKTLDATDIENVFDITLTVQTKTKVSEVEKVQPLDVVIVMDVSNTMKSTFSGDTNRNKRCDVAVAAASNFIRQFQQASENVIGDRRIGFVLFNTGLVNGFELQTCRTVAQADSMINTMTNVVNSFRDDENYKIADTERGRQRFTNMETGIVKAQQMLEAGNSPNKYMIFLTDGFPTTWGLPGTSFTTNTTSTNGIEPYDSEGKIMINRTITDSNGNVRNLPCSYGTSYSDTAAHWAEQHAAEARAAGIKIFAIGVDVAGQSIRTYEGQDESNKNNGFSVMETIGNSQPTWRKTGKYVIDDEKGGGFTGWLENYISSGPGYYFDSDKSSEMHDAFNTIFEAIKTQTEHAVSASWVAEDPITSGGSNDYIEFIRFYAQNGTPAGAELTGAAGEKLENTASWDSEKDAISWNLKRSGYEVSQGEDNTTYYTYKLKYRVRLKNEMDSFVENQAYDTNGTTALVYREVVDGSLRELKRIEFPIPEVKGYLNDFEFTKVIFGGEDKPLAGAEFTLTHDLGCGICRGNGRAVPLEVYSAVSGVDGVVSFANIPSGHDYILQEAKAPEGYHLEEAQYAVTIRYNEGVENEEDRTYAIITVVSPDGTFTKIEDAGSLKITNSVWYELPETGGAGTALYTLGGLCLMAGALLLYSLHNRRKGGRDSPC